MDKKPEKPANKMAALAAQIKAKAANNPAALAMYVQMKKHELKKKS